MVIVWRLRGNIIRTTVCWIVWHNVHSPQHTYVSSSHRSNRLGLSHWDPYAVCRGGCIELYYCNMMDWFWWDSSLISTTNWFSVVLWYCWFGHLACKNRPRNYLQCVEWDVKPYTASGNRFGLDQWSYSTPGPVSTRIDDSVRYSSSSAEKKSISVYNQPPRSTQPCHPFVGRRNEYQPNGGDALRLGSKGRYGSWVDGK